MPTDSHSSETFMEIGHIEIYAVDTAAMQKFYCEVLGFELTVVQHDKFVWIKRGALEILIRPGDPRPSASRYEDAPTGFVFYTSNMEETLIDLKAK